MKTYWLKMNSERRFWFGVIVLFALLAGLLYLPLLAGRIPFPSDLVLQFPAWSGSARAESWQYADIGDLATAFYPARAFAARAIHEGSLPLWNPYLLGGAPFLASAQSSLFYPPNFLYYVLPLPVAWTLCLMLRIFLAGIFMTLFVRHIGGSRAGSVFSGIAFAIGGFMTAWQGQPMGDSAIWLPLMCYAVLRLADADSNRWIALAAFVFAMPVLAGHPETAAHETLATIAIALVTWVSSHFRFRFACRFLLAGALAGGLASIQVIPTLEWLRQMPKVFDLSWPLLPVHQALAWVSRDMIRSPNSAGILVPEGVAYVGMITLIGAPLGLLHRAKRHILFLVSLTLAAVAIAYGVDPAHSLVAHIPILSGLKNSRMVFLAGFGIAALAGLGISFLEENPPLGWRHVFAFTLVMTAVALVFLLVYKLRLATVITIEFTSRPSFSRAMLLAGALTLLLRLYARLTPRAFSIMACSVLALDLITFSYGYMGFTTPDRIFPNAPVFDFLKKNADPDQFRVAQIDGPFSENANMFYEIASADGYEVKLTPRHSALSRDYTEPPLDGIFFTARQLMRFDDRRLDLLNVKYLVLPTDSSNFQRLRVTSRYLLAYNDGNLAAFENRTVLPRAFMVPAKGINVVPEIDEQIRILRNSAFDPQRRFVVSGRPDGLQQPTPSAASGLPVSRRADILSSHINEVVLRTASAEPSVLVVSQTYYPGWRAEVDGRKTEVFPVNITLTGLVVPPGLHDVRVVFQPNSFLLGAALSIISVVVSLVMLKNDWLLRPGSRRRPRATT
jgi:Bacterial membrane protein YfhO